MGSGNGVGKGFQWLSSRGLLCLRLFLFPVAVCSLPAILHTSISCDKSDFLLKIRFNATFTGMIFTEKGTPNCIYTDGSVQPSTIYNLKIPLTGCETHKNSEGNYENELVVQGGRAFVQGQDKRFLLTCIPAITPSSEVTVNFGGVTVDTAPSTASSINSTPAKIDYQVAVLDGASAEDSVLKRPLSVGDKVSYSVRVTTQSAARIGRCWATDGRSSLQLADERGCSLQTAGDVWSNFRVSLLPPNTTLFLNHIKAWAFPTSNEVNIFCNLHVCRSCSQMTCERDQRVTRSLKTSESPLTGQHEDEEEEEEGEEPSLSTLSSSSEDASDTDTVVAIQASFRLRREASPPPPLPSDAQQSLQRDPIVADDVPSSTYSLAIILSIKLILLLSLSIHT